MLVYLKISGMINPTRKILVLVSLLLSIAVLVINLRITDQKAPSFLFFKVTVSHLKFWL